MAEAHIRIDEGIKRGPKTRLGKPSRPADKADLGTWKIPEGLDPDEVLDRYLSEATTSQIAKQYGLSRKAMVKWLRENRPEEWKRTQIVKALIKKEDGDEGLESAPDALSLARARELVRSGQWDLERLDSSNFGQKQEVSVTIDHQVMVEHSLTVGASELLGRIRKGNAAVLNPVIESSAIPVDTQPVD